MPIYIWLKTARRERKVNSLCECSEGSFLTVSVWTPSSWERPHAPRSIGESAIAVLREVAARLRCEDRQRVRAGYRPLLHLTTQGSLWHSVLEGCAAGGF